MSPVVVFSRRKYRAARAFNKQSTGQAYIYPCIWLAGEPIVYQAIFIFVDPGSELVGAWERIEMPEDDRQKTVTVAGEEWEVEWTA